LVAKAVEMARDGGDLRAGARHLPLRERNVASSLPGEPRDDHAVAGEIEPLLERRLVWLGQRRRRGRAHGGPRMPHRAHRFRLIGDHTMYTNYAISGPGSRAHSDSSGDACVARVEPKSTMES